MEAALALPAEPPLAAPRGERGPRRPPFGRKSVIPGFGLTFGFTLAYLGMIVLVPLSAVVLKTAGMGWSEFVAVGLSERALAAYQLSFGAAFLAAAVNAVFGLLVAWILVRYDFAGKRVVGALVDLPFALPTAVAGIALTALYADTGWLGRHLAPLGIEVAFKPLGVVVALIFVGLPFVVRTVEPVLADVGIDVEEAAASLGAGRFQTFRRVLLPAILPALLTGFALAFARGVGEYGSVIRGRGRHRGRRRRRRRGRSPPRPGRDLRRRRRRPRAGRPGDACGPPGLPLPRPVRRSRLMASPMKLDLRLAPPRRPPTAAARPLSHADLRRLLAPRPRAAAPARGTARRHGFGPPGQPPVPGRGRRAGGRGDPAGPSSRGRTFLPRPAETVPACRGSRGQHASRPSLDRSPPRRRVRISNAMPVLALAFVRDQADSRRR